MRNWAIRQNSSASTQFLSLVQYTLRTANTRIFQQDSQNWFSFRYFHFWECCFTIVKIIWPISKEKGVPKIMRNVQIEIKLCFRPVYWGLLLSIAFNDFVSRQRLFRSDWAVTQSYQSFRCSIMPLLQFSCKRPQLQCSITSSMEYFM